MEKRRVTTIPATISKLTSKPINEIKKRRVAGYARVSTGNEDQTTSYAAQVDYYTNYIKNREDWEFAGIFTDEGISGTNTTHRDGFNNMIAQAMAGEIDLIITKSVSRFARNTVDSLTTVRNLKDKGVEVYFEKENIWTLDSKGELLITIMSSLAQEESRSISENVTWGHRKRMADGKVSFPYSKFLGYTKDENNNIVIVDDEAETVRLIYRLFLEGLTPHTIAKELTKRGLKSATGLDRWHPTAVKAILTNEKYKGDALLQKTFTVDFLSKKTKINNGELPQYYVEGSHPAIISPELFEMVQKELKERLKVQGRYSGVDKFSAKLRCGNCGSFYGPKVWHSNDKYRKVIYQCNKKCKNKCTTPHLNEKEIERIFINAVNQLLSRKKEIIENLRFILKNLFDNTNLQKEKERLENELNIIAEMINGMISENARVVQNQELYQSKYDEMVKQYDSIKDRYEEVTTRISDNASRAEMLKHFMKTIESQPELITDFDEHLWVLVDHMTIYNKDNIKVTFKDGTEI